MNQRGNFLDTDIVILGAGVAGLSCAGRLREAGVSAQVLEKARGVGGRCATRRVQGQPVDHGVIFLHGSDPSFLAAIDEVDSATPLEGWPQKLSGSGTPCQPEAFHTYERRIAFAEGISAFPKHFARDLDIHLNTRVETLACAKNTFILQKEDGTTSATRTLVVTAPISQTRELLKPLPDLTPELESVRMLLDMMSSEPCLTLLAGYSLDNPAPPWDVCYPEDSAAFLLISHDSAKRDPKQFHTLVYQCRPRWSREKLEQNPAVWSQEILDEAGRLVGPWALQPKWTQTHRWRYARVEPASALASPMLLELEQGQRLGLAGEVFAPNGGVEAAWLSGRRLADRILGEQSQ
jgi:predicted NAD/FAD-dependent oxidoreductase